MKQTYLFGSYPKPKAYHVPGTSCTIQDLAPDLRAIVQSSSVSGDPLPLTSEPQYDETDEIGLARLDLSKSDLSDIRDVALDAYPVSASDGQASSQPGNKDAVHENSESADSSDSTI